MRPQLAHRSEGPVAGDTFIQSRPGDPARTIGFGMNLFPGYNQALLLESVSASIRCAISTTTSSLAL